ncbi:MAG TPA: HopJ type III effector protein [Gallionella sp.]
MKLSAFLRHLDTSPELVTFDDTMALIDSLYEYTPTRFRNGALVNEAGQNNGSCKLFAFAGLHGLSQQQTLNCFGAYYRDDVLKHPAGTDHQNIRNFIKSGWEGVEFDGSALRLKP